MPVGARDRVSLARCDQPIANLVDSAHADVRTLIAARDERAFAQLVGELGLDFSLAALVSYIGRFESTYVAEIGKLVVRLAAEALSYPPSHAWENVFGLTCLVVRADARIAIGIQPADRRKPFPKTGWAMGRWFTEPNQNRPTAEAWARDPSRADDSLLVPLRRGVTSPASDQRGAALFAAVIAAPSDLVARQVYGDWLLEHGDARGELIQLQCMLKNTAALSPDQRAQLAMRSLQLLNAHMTELLAPVERFTRSATIQHGLVEVIEISVPQLEKHGTQLVADHPICEVRVAVRNPQDLLRLAALTCLSRIAALAIEAPVAAPGLGAVFPLGLPTIATSAIFANLESLTISHAAEDDRALADFVTHLHAPRLAVLSLHYVDVGVRTLQALAKPTTLPTLQYLWLDNPRRERRGVLLDDMLAAIDALATRGIQVSTSGA